MPLSSKTKNKIIKHTEDFFDNTIFKLEVNPDIIEKAYPWHYAFFNVEAAIAALKERSLVTSIGMKFVPQLAKIVAEDKYKKVFLEKPIQCKLDKGSIKKIDDICLELRGDIAGKKRTPAHDNEMKEIKKAKTGKKTQIRVICDLYIDDHKDGPLFYEIKAPKPNKDQTTEAKKKILLFRQISNKHNGFFALHYNPYITKDKYSWPFCINIMDIEKQVMLGEEMWNYIGDSKTYPQVLKLINKTSKKKWKEFEKVKM